MANIHSQVLYLPPITSSMQVDIREGRMLETDAIFGVVIRKAREKGVAVPTLQVVNALLMGINARIAAAKEVPT